MFGKTVFVALALVAAVAAPPVKAQQSDAADSIYREARSLLNEREFEAAASLFRQVRDRYAQSDHVGDTYYWEAFAFNRMGQLEQAIDLLDQQAVRHPGARTSGEAASLKTRICGELASRGDERCAREVGRASRDSTVTDDMRMAALNALINMRSERAMPILRRMIVNYDLNPDMRQQVMFMVAEQAEPAEAVDLLSQAANNDPDREVRQQAVFWLSEVSGDAAVDALLDILADSDDSGVLEQAVFALSQHGSGRAMQAVRDLVLRDDVPSNVREQAIFRLGSEGSADDLRTLRTLYSDLTSGDMKDQIIYAVAEAGGSENSDWLLQLALDEDEDIDRRKSALFWLGESGMSVTQLNELYDTLTDREIREHLIFVFSQSDEPAAVDRLLSIARNDSDIRLREQAIFWLSESDDPRALDFLVELIEQ